MRGISMKRLLTTLLFVSASTQADVLIINNDAGGEGFNDTTSVSPVGGNPGTTRGQQRLNVFQKAAEILNATYDISVDVRVASSFDPLSCSSGSAILGQAGPAAYEYIYASRDVIPHALNNQLQGYDTDAGYQDINAQFNSSIDNNDNCLYGTNWYYGYDEPTGVDKSLLSVVLHEIMHGMGFLSTLQWTGQAGGGWNVNGSFVEGFDPYTRKLKDASTGQFLINQAASTRASVMTSVNNLVWGGSEANGQAGNYTLGTNGGAMKMYAPASYESGSSVSHFDTTLTPNELMEPSYTDFLATPGLGEELLVDIGWSYNSTPAANNAPVLASIGSQTVAEDNSKTVALSATDADGDPLTYSLSSATSTLGASISGTTLTLQPTSNYNGVGSLTVVVTDGTDTDSETVSVTVTPVNDAPVLAAIGDKSVNEDSSSSFNVSATDVDGDTLTYSITSASATLGASISGSLITLTPVADFNGTGSLTVQVSDGSLTDAETITVNVTAQNDAPVLNAIGDQSLSEDSSITVALGATDADGDSLSYSVSSANVDLGASVSGTTLTLNPSADYNGSGTITVTVNDGALSDAETLTVTVTPVNDAPVISNQSDITLAYSATQTITLVASDVDGDSLTFSAASADTALATTSVSGNQLTVTATGNTEESVVITVDVTDGSLSDQMTFTVTLVDPAVAAPLTASAGGTGMSDGDSLDIALEDVSLTLAGGTGSYSVTVFYDGSDRSELLSSSGASITLAMPESGAFAGTYRIDVDDGDTTATFWLVRPLRISSSVSPLLHGSESAQLMIEGAPVGTTLSFSASPANVTFASAPSTPVTSADAPDDAGSFNTASVYLVAGITGTATVSVTGAGVPDATVDLDVAARRSVIITVRDDQSQLVSDAELTFTDTRFSEWGLTDAYTTDASGRVTVELPDLDMPVSLSAENYATSTSNISSGITAATLYLESAATLYTVSGQINARGFTFNLELPRLSVRMSDGTTSLPEVDERSNTRVEYEWSTPLTGAMPEALVVSHSLVPDIEIPLNPAFTEESVDITLAASASTEATSSGAGNGLWLLPLLLLLGRRRT